MRPLQKNQINNKPTAEVANETTKMLQAMPSISTKNATMKLHEAISSYKCFEASVTSSQLPLDLNRNLSNLLRSNSLDSLANSSEQDCGSTGSESGDEDNVDNKSVTDADQVSDIDSINDIEDRADSKKTGNEKSSSAVNTEKDNSVVQKDIDVGYGDREPVIKAYLEKSNSKCDNQNCGFLNCNRHYTNNLNDTEENYLHVNHCNCTSNSSNLSISGQGSHKSRRTSIASVNSVARMETIVEEPIEPKISVKEILARFETLTSLEVQSKASTISSGARAAAQTLNVPIERLEAQIHSSSKAAPQSPVINNKERSNRNYLEESIDNKHTEHNGKAHIQLEHKQQQQHHHQQPQQQQLQQIHHQHYHNNNNNNNKAISSDQEMGGMSHQPDYEDQMSSLPASPQNTKYSLLQFAMQHFQDDVYAGEEHHINGRGQKRSVSNRPHSDLVKWQGYSIRSPLLRLPAELAPLAIECFECVLRYCGDLPPDPDLTEVKCVYTILMHCHKHLTLRDEVYCQLMKQTTNNRSQAADSSQRAWRLLSILAAYFSCSDALKPYLLEHLSTAATDRRRQSHGTAAVCLSNLRKTARCGGRKNVPSVEEVTAVSAGRSARRQIYRLPGGAERVVNTRCSTVVADVIAELCSLLSIDSPIEQEEFSLYCIVQGDAFTMPLAADEYILDVTTELLKSGQPFYLIFCRSVWHFPLKRDPAPTPLYIEVLFNQVAPDYLEGLLLELPNAGAPPPDIVRDMARIAALLHRAADLSHVPAMKEIKFLLPKPALGIRELRPAQWVALVQSAWPSIATLEPTQVKAQFLTVLSSWALFGSSFFAVRKVWAEDNLIEDTSPIWKEIILALNRRGVLFLEPNTHETLQHWPFMEVISTRKVRSEDGALFLDMKVGNLMQQRVVRVQTEQAHEISRLIRQYITMAQVNQRDGRRE